MSLLEHLSSHYPSALRPGELDDAGDASFQMVGGHRRTDAADGSTDTVESLLLSIARGDLEAFVTLQSRVAGLLRVNIRRVLRDASRSEAVTEETFAGVFEDAIHFDPRRDDAETWLLMRAHEHATDGLRSVDTTADPPRGSTRGALTGIP